MIDAVAALAYYAAGLVFVALSAWTLVRIIEAVA